jgi:hypothetical protein
LSHPNIFFCNTCGDRVDKELYDAVVAERNAFSNGAPDIRLAAATRERDEAVRAMNDAHESLRKSGEQDAQLRAERDEALKVVEVVRAELNGCGNFHLTNLRDAIFKFDFIRTKGESGK